MNVLDSLWWCHGYYPKPFILLLVVCPPYYTNIVVLYIFPILIFHPCVVNAALFFRNPFFISDSVAVRIRCCHFSLELGYIFLQLDQLLNFQVFFFLMFGSILIQSLFVVLPVYFFIIFDRIIFFFFIFMTSNIFHFYCSSLNVFLPCFLVYKFFTQDSI